MRAAPPGGLEPLRTMFALLERRVNQFAAELGALIYAGLVVALPLRDLGLLLNHAGDQLVCAIERVGTVEFGITPAD